jgi:hypothetical protein
MTRPARQLDCTVLDVRELRFDDGTPVRAASAIAPLAGGWLVAQDDATHGAWLRGDGVARLRLLPPVDGLDLFDEASGTKHRKPDLEAACDVGDGTVLLLGSGSLPARMRAVLVRGNGAVAVGDLTELYARVAELLGIAPADVNLEGATVVAGALRWFQRGIPARDVPSASVDVDLPALLAVVTGAGTPAAVGFADPRRYELGQAGGHPLAITDAVTLHDGTVLVSAAAEAAPSAVDDGEVHGSALALLDGTLATAGGALAGPDGSPVKVEGLAVVEEQDATGTVLAVVDSDDPTAASLALTVRIRRG